jgi:hypothetical protein
MSGQPQQSSLAPVCQQRQKPAKDARKGDINKQTQPDQPFPNEEQYQGCERRKT